MNPFYLYQLPRMDYNIPITSVKVFEDKLPREAFLILLDSHEFKAEENFFLDLEEDERVWYVVSDLARMRCESALDIIHLYNKSKAAKRSRYADRIEANPALWESLMPMIKTPLRQLLPAKEWLSKCLEAGAGPEDLIALMQLYNEFSGMAWEYNLTPENVDQLAPWTTAGRYFDLERDLAKLERDFAAASSIKAKREVLAAAQDRYTGRAGYPRYFTTPMDEKIHALYRGLEQRGKK